MFKPCVIIPVYNHERAIGAVIDGVLAQKLPCIVVDDGSGSACASVLEELACRAPDKITLLRHPHNRGKGSAVLTGIRYAAQCDHSHAVQIDADGDLVTLHNGYHSGVPELPPTITLSAFGAETAVTGARGETLIIDDARSDQRTAAVFDASYGPAAARSVVSVPGAMGNSGAMASTSPRELPASTTSTMKRT